MKKTDGNAPMNQPEYKLMYEAENDLWWYKGLRQFLLIHLHKFAKKKSKILDAGCGTGKNIEFLSKNDYKVSGIDFSTDAIRFCTQRGIKSVKKSSITDIPYKDNYFDVVICMDVLGMLTSKDCLISIAECHRVLKANGILMIQCAAYEWLRSQHDIVSCLRVRYTLNELQALFITRDWTILFSTYRMFLLFLPLVSIKLFKRLLSTISAKQKGDLFVPPKIINNLLFFIQQIENKITFTTFPFGTSCFLILKKNT